MRSDVCWRTDPQLTSLALSLFLVYVLRFRAVRYCGSIFCSSCTRERALIDGKSSRVCDVCIVVLRDSTQRRLEHQQQTSYATRAPKEGDTTTLATRPASNSTVASSNIDLTIERVIYATASLCPRCALLEKRGFTDYKAAELFDQHGAIWLRVRCERHGAHVTLICKDRGFYMRCQAYQERWNEALRTSGLTDGTLPSAILQGTSSVGDMEDIGRQLTSSLQSTSPPIDNLPMSFELTLHANGEFLSDTEIERRLVAFVRKLPAATTVPGARKSSSNGGTEGFLLRLLGGLVPRHEIPLLNAKILRLVSLFTASLPGSTTRPHPVLTSACQHVRVLVDVSYERLVDLLNLEDSVFLKIRVMPCVRYFLGPGEEDQFTSEMDHLLSLVRTISDLELVLNLSLEPPYPNMQTLFDYIRAAKGVIRFVIIQRERSPKEILARLQEGAGIASPGGTTAASRCSQPTLPVSSHPESVDPYSLLECIDAGTGGALRPSDFLPLSVSQLFEPLLQMFGYGAYHLSPAHFCGFVTALVTTPSLTSIPMTRLFDMEQLHTSLLPLAQKMKYAAQAGQPQKSIGIAQAKIIQKALKAAAYNVEVRSGAADVA
jgi:hypothetical protein